MRVRFVTLHCLAAAGALGLLGGLAGGGCRLLELAANDAPPVTAAEGIRREATRPNDDPAGRPLPLACCWTCGHYQADFMEGWRPRNQMRLIEEWHHLLPWFSNAYGDVPTNEASFTLTYYRDAILQARELRLPLTFVGSQWESGLSRKPYIDLPPDENPNVVTTNGLVEGRVCPFGPLQPWREIGRRHTDNPMMKQIQEWYPDPPMVIFLSNNEHGKLRWHEVERSKRSVYRAKGQVYNPERYGGFVQFGMWLMRPRAVRNFRGWTESWVDRFDKDGKLIFEGGGPYFMAIVEAVDRVHNNVILREWWRHGTLVPNRAHAHPYQEAIPEEYRNEDRWFLLDTDRDPPWPWHLSTELPVLALALTRGAAPQRQWLVHAHAPTGLQQGVQVVVPDYRTITIDVPVGGVFYQVDEASGTVTDVTGEGAVKPSGK